jgi:hypothetical protein
LAGCLNEADPANGFDFAHRLLYRLGKGDLRPQGCRQQQGDQAAWARTGGVIPVGSLLIGVHGAFPSGTAGSTAADRRFIGPQQGLAVSPREIVILRRRMHQPERRILLVQCVGQRQQIFDTGHVRIQIRR